MSNNYKVVVDRLDNYFVLHIEDLNIIVKDKSLERAYSRLEQEKLAYLDMMRKSGIEIIKYSSAAYSPLINSLKLKKFLATSLVCIFLFSISSFIAGIFFKKGINLVGSKVNTSLERVSDLDEKERMLLFQEKLELLRPYILEIKKSLDK